jgi:hypothetical protein
MYMVFVAAGRSALDKYDVLDFDRNACSSSASPYGWTGTVIDGSQPYLPDRKVVRLLAAFSCFGRVQWLVWRARGLVELEMGARPTPVAP